MKTRLLILALFAAFGQAAHAGQQEATQAYQARDYPRAAALYLAAYDQERAVDDLYNAACSYALAGDAERALATLRRAMDAGFLNADQAAHDSDFAALGPDPRWTALLAEMGARRDREAKLFDSPALDTPYAENISEDEKVAGLSKFWSEVKYNFVYTDTLKTLDWDRLYLAYLPKVRATKSTAEYYRVLMELCAQLKDGHTNVYPPQQAAAEFYGRPLMRMQLAEGRVFVKSVFSPELTAQGVVPGLEITSVDGVPSAQYRARELAPFASASTPHDLAVRTGVYGFLSGPVAAQPRVTFAQADGKQFTVPVARADVQAWNRARPPVAPFEYRMLPGKVAYVALNGFDNNAAADGFMQAWPELAQASALVIDVRMNGGGSSNVGYRVLATLADQPFATSQWSTRDYKPSYRAWGRPQPLFTGAADKVPNDPQHHFAGKVVVLTGPMTYSAAEDFAVAFDEMKRGVIIGEATGGSTGQPLFFKLPGGGQARVCTKKDTYADGKPFVGVGVQPQVEAHQTIADLRKGRDTVLEAALTYLKK
ncbi:MAG: S41 family peptidase [Telluria sp.]